MAPDLRRGQKRGSHPGTGQEGSGSQPNDASTVRTLGDAIAEGVRKELLELWARDDPDSLKVSLVDPIVASLAPALAEKLVEVAKNLFPNLTVEAGSPLPQAPARPVGGSLGQHAIEHADLLDHLQAFLSSHDLLQDQAETRSFLKTQVATQLPMSHPWQRWLCGGCALLLPADAVLSLSAVTAPVLLADYWLTSVGHEDEDTNSGQGGSPLHGGEGFPAGAPQGLAKAMRCRRRVFALERELIAREKAEAEREAFEKAERAKSEARLMDVNRALEDKLKVRTEELRRAGQKIIEAQRVVDDTRSQLAAKKKEIAQLKYQLDQKQANDRDHEAREQQHNRAVLRQAAHQSLLYEKAKKQIDMLSRCHHGEEIAELLKELAMPQMNPETLSTMTENMEADFMTRIKHRKEQYGAVLGDLEDSIAKKRSEYDQVCKMLKDKENAYQYATMAAARAANVQIFEALAS